MCVLLALLVPPVVGQVYVFDNTLNGVKNSGGLGIANAAATGSVVLVTADTTGSGGAIGNTSSASGRTLTVASGTVSGDTGAYSDTVRVITGGSRQVNNQAGALNFTFQNLHFKDVHAANAHGVFAWFNAGAAADAINFTFDNVTFENFSNETAGNLGAVLANYTSTRNMTITAGPGGYTMLNNHAVGGGVIFDQKQLVLNGTTPTPANIVFSNNTYGIYQANVEDRPEGRLDILAMHLDINGNGKYTFDGGVSITQRLRFQNNVDVTFAPGSYFGVSSGNVLQLNGNAKVTLDQIRGYSSPKDLNVNDTSTLIVNHSITEGSDTLNLGSVVARGDSTIIKTGTANLAMSTTASAISGVVDLQGGGISISGVGANKPTLKAAAGTTFTSSSSGGLELTAASEVNGADINLTAGTMKINNDNIKLRNFTKPSVATLNTQGNTMTVSGRMETGNNFFEMTGGTLGVSGANVGSTTEATTLTLRGGTMKTDLSVTAPIVINGDELPVTTGLYIQWDASNTASFETDANGIRAWNKTAGSAADFKSGYYANAATGVVLRVNGGNAAAPTAADLPKLVVDNDLGMQVVQMADGKAHFFRFTESAAIQSVFMVMKDSQLTQSFLLGQDGSGKAYHFHRGGMITGGEYDGTRALLDGTNSQVAKDANAANPIATVQLDGVTVNPAQAGLAKDKWALISISSSNKYTANTFSKDRNLNTTERSWNGSIAEVLIFNQQLDSMQMAMVNAYLNEKWGLGFDISNTYTPEVPIYNLDVAESGTLDARGLSTVGFNKVAIQPNQMLNIQQDAGAKWQSDFDVQGTLKFNDQLLLTGDYTQSGTLGIDIGGLDQFSSITTDGLATLIDGAVFDINTSNFEVTDGMVFDILMADEFASGVDLSKYEFLSDAANLEWIASLAGDTLSITANIGSSGGEDSGVPEPSTWVMLCLGLGLLIWRRKLAA